MSAGIGFVTEERKRDGLALDADVLENGGMASMRRVMTGPFIHGARQKEMVGGQIRDLDIRPPKLGQILRRMSGGNQQKVILGKWLLMEGLQVLLLDEPTRGVDVATKFEIYKLIAELAADGMTVVLVSSEMPELIGLSHRILVMKDGRIAGECAGDGAPRGRDLSPCHRGPGGTRGMTDATTQGTVGASNTRKPMSQAARTNLIFGLSVIALIALAALTSDAFLTERNLTNVARQMVTTGFLAIGMYVVIRSGGIDLSVGSTLAFAAVLVSGLQDLCRWRSRLPRHLGWACLLG